MQPIETKTTTSGPMKITTTTYRTTHNYHGMPILLQESQSTLNGRTLTDWWVNLETKHPSSFIGTFSTVEKALAFYGITAP